MISRVHVPSFTGSGRYLVEREAEGITCSCPAYGYNSEHPKRCKHTDLVLAADRLLARCASMHDTPGACLCRACLVDLYALLAGRKQRAKKSTRGRRRASSD